MKMKIFQISVMMKELILILKIMWRFNRLFGIKIIRAGSEIKEESKMIARTRRNRLDQEIREEEQIN